MTDRTSAIVVSLAANVRPSTIAAYRYLAFLDLERRELARELFPDRKPDEGIFVPCDRLVNLLCWDGSPLDRAVPVLAALGIDPHADDAWCELLGKMVLTIPPAKTPPRR